VRYTLQNMQEQDYLWEAADSWRLQRESEAQSVVDRDLAKSIEAEDLRHEVGVNARQLAMRTENEEAAGRELEEKLGVVHGPAFVDRKSECVRRVSEFDGAFLKGVRTSGLGGLLHRASEDFLSRSWR
jgi:hypothetical protein